MTVLASLTVNPSWVCQTPPSQLCPPPSGSGRRSDSYDLDWLEEGKADRGKFSQLQKVKPSETDALEARVEEMEAQQPVSSAKAKRLTVANKELKKRARNVLTHLSSSAQSGAVGCMLGVPSPACHLLLIASASGELHQLLKHSKCASCYQAICPAGRLLAICTRCHILQNFHTVLLDHFCPCQCTHGSNDISLL